MQKKLNARATQKVQLTVLTASEIGLWPTASGQCTPRRERQMSGVQCSNRVHRVPAFTAPSGGSGVESDMVRKHLWLQTDPEHPGASVWVAYVDMPRRCIDIVRP